MFDDIFFYLFDGWDMASVELIVAVSVMMIVATPLTLFFSFKIYPKVNSQNLNVLLMLGIIVASLVVGFAALRVFQSYYGPATYIETTSGVVEGFNLRVNLKFCQYGFVRDGQIFYTDQVFCGR
tara:strand:- start:549 stop:920 length:372 start_codon:yes stop_codon:yes gene_type:complete